MVQSTTTPFTALAAFSSENDDNTTILLLSLPLIFILPIIIIQYGSGIWWPTSFLRDPTGKQQRSSNHGTIFFSIRFITHFGILILISIIIDCIVCGCVCYITVGDVFYDQYRDVDGYRRSRSAGDWFCRLEKSRLSRGRSDHLYRRLGDHSTSLSVCLDLFGVGISDLLRFHTRYPRICRIRTTTTRTTPTNRYKNPHHEYC